MKNNTEEKTAFMKKVSAVIEKLETEREQIGFLIWQRKHSKKLWENSNLNQPPIELDFDPALYEDDEKSMVTEEQIQTFLASMAVQSETDTGKPEEADDKRTKEDTAADQMSAADVVRNYARALQEADEIEKELEQRKAEENEIKQLEAENEQLENEIAQLKAEIADLQKESRKTEEPEKENAEK